MKNKLQIGISLILFQLVIFHLNSFAQSKPDSIKNAFLPAFTYTSDFGFIGGGIYSRLNFGQDEKPFKNQLLFNGLASTKGYASIQLVYDQVRTFDTNYRSYYEFNLFRLFQNNFFGIGNDLNFDNDRWENEDYFYESRNFRFLYRGRYPIYKEEESIKRFDVLALSEYTYEMAIEREETSALSTIQPLGTGESQLWTIGTGFFWENRDNEIIPTKGYWTEFQVSGSVPGISDYQNITTMFRHHSYFTFKLITDFTIAHRIYWRHIFGDSPFWYLSDAGINSTLRGYPFRRFIDKGAITSNLELRAWLFEYKPLTIRGGGYIFTDVGRVFSDLNEYEEIFNTPSYAQTYGLGATGSIFNPNFFIRMEYGFSNELSRFYAGIGYLF